MKKNPKHTLKIDGMTCTNCSFSVERAIKKLGGQEINVNFSTGEASFTGDIDIKEVKSSIRLSGFTIIKNENEKKIQKLNTSS
jgi:Cu+-exporting ATPase